MKNINIFFGKFIEITWYTVLTILLISIISILPPHILFKNIKEEEYIKQIENTSTLVLLKDTFIQICIFSFFIYVLKHVFRNIPLPFKPKRDYIPNLKGEAEWGVTMGLLLVVGESNPYLELNVRELRTRFIQFTGIGKDTLIDNKKKENTSE